MERSGRDPPKAATPLLFGRAGFGGNRLSISAQGGVLYAVVYGSAVVNEIHFVRA